MFYILTTFLSNSPFRGINLGETFNFLTEGGDTFITEGGDNFITEDAP